MHIFRPGDLQPKQSSPAFLKERLSSQHHAFFPQWNYTFTFLLNFPAVARGQIFHQIALTILFTNPHGGEIPGKVVQLFSHAACSPSESGWMTMCWHNAPAMPVFVAEETWGQSGGATAFVLQNKQKTALVTTKEKTKCIKKSIRCSI